MNIKENVKKLKMNSYKWTCPKCDTVVGPEMTEEKVIEKAKEHARKKHGE